MASTALSSYAQSAKIPIPPAAMEELVKLGEMYAVKEMEKRKSMPKNTAAATTAFVKNTVTPVLAGADAFGKATAGGKSTAEATQVAIAETKKVAANANASENAAPAKAMNNTAAANAEILARAQKVRDRVHSNLRLAENGPYGTRTSRANKARNAAVTYYRAALKNGKALNSPEVNTQIKEIISFAVQPRSNRPPRMSNMAWASVGALAATGVALGAVVGGGAAAAAIQQLGRKIANIKSSLNKSKLAANAAANAAKRAAMNAAKKKAAANAANAAAQLAKPAAKAAANKAASAAKQAAQQAALQETSKAAFSEAANKQLKATLGQHKLLRNALESVVSGSTVPTGKINRLVQLFGPQVRIAFEGAPNAARQAASWMLKEFPK